ncbi:MAG: hypothetical protein VB853_09440, partial [Pirellulales bacterium]
TRLSGLSQCRRYPATIAGTFAAAGFFSYAPPPECIPAAARATATILTSTHSSPAEMFDKA